MFLDFKISLEILSKSLITLSENIGNGVSLRIDFNENCYSNNKF